MKSIVIIIDYFGGKWPEWFPIFLESCKYNPTINWLIHSDCPLYNDNIENISFRHLSFDEYVNKVNCKLKTSFNPQEGYKLCEIKPMLGYIHEDEIRSFDFFGFGDLDVIYGDIRKFYTDRVLENNIISNHIPIISGHLALFRNKKWIRNSFRRIKSWKEIVNYPNYMRLDEDLFIKVFTYPAAWKEKWNFIYDIFHPLSLRYRRKIYLREQYTTPLTSYPWIDMTTNHPTIWYWRNGKVTNELDGEVEFIYLHFMNFRYARWMNPKYGSKGFWEKKDKIIHFDLRNIPTEIRIDPTGFHSVNKTTSQ